MSKLPPRDDIIYYSTKTWEHVVSTAFRQHKAYSHCRFLHGYGLTVKAIFGAYELDDRNWVVDFGSLKSFKGWMEDMFDHKLLIAEDDPARTALEQIDIFDHAAEHRVVTATGCEAMARLCFEQLEGWLTDNGYAPRCFLKSVEVSEHSGNSGLVERTPIPTPLDCGQVPDAT